MTRRQALRQMERVAAQRRVLAWRRLAEAIDAVHAAVPPRPAPSPEPVAVDPMIAMVTGVVIKAALTVLYDSPQSAAPLPTPAPRPVRARPAVLIDLSKAPSSVEQRAAGWAKP